MTMLDDRATGPSGERTGAAGEWIPYESAPVLTSAMTKGGPSAVPAAELARLRVYLEAVAQDRVGPLHTAVAFNAAYFGYETGGEGYGNGAFDLDAFPVLSLDREIPALPVGSLVRIETGSDPLYAEIVYKESWGPARAVDEASARGTLVRRELLVPDLRVFGPGLALDERKLARLRARGRWLDQHGHVSIDARYRDSWVAGLDDTAAFAQHLLTTQIDSLLDPLVPVSVVHLAGSRRPERLRDALGNLLAVIAHVLDSSSELRRVGAYALTRRRIGQGLSGDGPLCAADMGALANTLQNSPVLSGRRRRYGIAGQATVDTRIRHWLSDVRDAEPLLTGVEYAVSVCRANLAMADFVSRDGEGGVMPNGVRVECVDLCEDGGVWRSTYSSQPDTATSGSSSDEAVEAENLGGTVDEDDIDGGTDDEAPGAPAPEPEQPEPPAPVEVPLPDDEHLGAPHSLRITDSEITWRVPLRLTHLMNGTLPLRSLVLQGLSGPGAAHPARLELQHSGGDIDPSEEVQETVVTHAGDHGLMTGITWPIDFFPGLLLLVQWPRGGRVFTVATLELETPVEVDGDLITHAYDSQVLLRDGAPGSTRDGDRASGLSPHDLVLRAVRRCGHLTVDGHALLDRDVLPHAVHGPDVTPTQLEILARATDELVAQRRLYAATGSRDPYGVPRHPAHPGWPRIPLIGYDPAPVPKPGARRPGGPIARPGANVEYHVAGFIRRLPAGSEPSAEQRAAYRAHCRRVGKADGWELPLGYTFVTGHARRR